MDPLRNLESTGGRTVLANQEEAEEILFSRPINLMPTNPFAEFADTKNSNVEVPRPTPTASEKHRFPRTLSDADESEIEFEKRFRTAKPNGVTATPVRQGRLSQASSKMSRNSSEFGYDSDEDRLDIAKMSRSLGLAASNGSVTSNNNNRRESFHSLNISTPNSTGVRAEDVLFTSIIFLSHLSSFVTDFSLMCWYYWNEEDFKWCSALTFLVLIVGSIGILLQFNQAEVGRLDRLFSHGRRVQILVNCFPPLGTILCSYYSMKSAWRAQREPVHSVHFFAIEEFSQSLSRIQGFFQSAPQAVLQLVILMETSGDMTLGKGLLTLSSVTLSLMVMTIANLPGRSDIVETSVRKGIYSPVSRIFLGVRMISSFGSRTMALTYFLMSFRCVLGTPSTPLSIVIGVCLITLPRLGFTLIDYCYHLQRVRRGRESVQGQFGRLSFCGTSTGYMATIFFPMSHPLWVFWFIWIETLVFTSIGFIVTLTASSSTAAVPEVSQPCVSKLVNFVYTGIFLVLFIVIPVLLPYARATVKHQRSRKIARMFEERERGVANLQHHVTESV